MFRERRRRNMKERRFNYHSLFVQMCTHYWYVQVQRREHFFHFSIFTTHYLAIFGRRSLELLKSRSFALGDALRFVGYSLFLFVFSPFCQFLGKRDLYPFDSVRDEKGVRNIPSRLMFTFPTRWLPSILPFPFLSFLSFWL